MSENGSDYWIDIAEYDLETAKAMQKTGRFLYVGFMCHQAVEKALKAMIAKNGTTPPRVHALVRLAELSGLTNVLAEDQKSLLNELLPLNVEARYPSQKENLAESLNERYCADLVAGTGELLAWIKQQL